MSAEPKPLGCCALCGNEVYPGDGPFTKLDDHGQYACAECMALCCVLCGNPEATVQDDEDEEPLCADCAYKVRHRAEEMYAEQQFQFYKGWSE